MPSPSKFSRSLFGLLFITLLAAAGCRAQKPDPYAGLPAMGSTLPPEVARRVEALLRQKGNLPPASVVNIGPRVPGPIAGYDQITVTFTGPDEKTSRPLIFLISPDNKTLAQFSTFDISADPRNVVSAAGRPARGGPDNAPVLIVGFDDLECPYCAKLHASIFPALINRYGDLVHIVYRDFPLEQHPWAMRAAVDVNCIAAQSPTGYWNLVDYIHAHGDEIGADPKDAKAEKTLAHASEQLDGLTREQGKFQHVDQPKLEACIAKQDTAAMEASRQLAVSLNVDSTPALFINGDKIDGAVPIDFVDKIIDQALIAAGKTPPPYPPAPPVAPKPPAASATKPADN